jgi:hypothetical protein
MFNPLPPRKIAATARKNIAHRASLSDAKKIRANPNLRAGKVGAALLLTCVPGSMSLNKTSEPTRTSLRCDATKPTGTYVRLAACGHNPTCLYTRGLRLWIALSDLFAFFEKTRPKQLEERSGDRLWIMTLGG